MDTDDSFLPAETKPAQTFVWCLSCGVRLPAVMRWHTHQVGEQTYTKHPTGPKKEV